MNPLRFLTRKSLALSTFVIVLVGMACGDVFAQATGGAALPDAPSIDIPMIWWIAPIGAILALFFANVFYKQMMAADEGDPDMIKKRRGFIATNFGWEICLDSGAAFAIVPPPVGGCGHPTAVVQTTAQACVSAPHHFGAG